MKLLFDANISWRIVKLILPYFPDSLQVESTELPEAAKDVQIRSWAKKND
jgi:predicted nuclease of predicted toxin-antitoxin system